MADTTPPTRRSPAIFLFLAVHAYAIVNGLAVALVTLGVVHPPWAILFFFTFVAPVLGTASVLLIHFISLRGGFGWPAVFGFITVMAIAAYVNYQVVCWASATV